MPSMTSEGTPGDTIPEGVLGAQPDAVHDDEVAGEGGDRMEIADAPGDIGTSEELPTQQEEGGIGGWLGRWRDRGRTARATASAVGTVGRALVNPGSRSSPDQPGPEGEDLAPTPVAAPVPASRGRNQTERIRRHCDKSRQAEDHRA